MLKEQIDIIVAEILRDVSGVGACRYYTDKILAKVLAAGYVSPGEVEAKIEEAKKQDILRRDNE